ncbi:hypothetical protein [Hyphomicrobium facile]|uniref:Uncharacterized protein n=1 Tax=Hyphomicrobium facile TaxID=51670 RepID=A0A1I7NS52_9HYPH|nr:hypothetical protein [Hyphomicrobium facile]SFV37476.1 hypothetical protein SAMN04488557_3182 [Hyphomicrobium facile]
MRNKSPKPNDGKAGDGKTGGEDTCAGHALGFPLRAELDFLPIENVTLDIFRCLCEVYTTGSAQPWEIAMKEAEAKLGPAEGPLLVARVTALLRALRSERKVGFSYLSIGCQHVSPDELSVSGLLKAARSGNESALDRGLKLLVEDPQAPARTQFAARALASMQSQHIASDANVRDESRASQKKTAPAHYLH